MTLFSLHFLGHADGLVHDRRLTILAQVALVIFVESIEHVVAGRGRLGSPRFRIDTTFAHEEAWRNERPDGKLEPVVERGSICRGGARRLLPRGARRRGGLLRGRQCGRRKPSAVDQLLVGVIKVALLRRELAAEALVAEATVRLVRLFVHGKSATTDMGLWMASMAEGLR